MASNSAARASAPQDAGSKPKETALLWNPDNVKDVSESLGIGTLNDEALRTLAQDVEYRIGQVIIEALRFMKAAKRSTLTTQDISSALKTLDVEPLYGYDSTRPLRYGEASMGPGQPLFYIEDEEVDFEKLINNPLPKVPRDSNFTGHWLAIEGVQPTIPQNPSTNESRSQELLPKGPGANPALPALAGNQGASFRPAVKHIISTELTLYFEKVQSALLDDNPEPVAQELRAAALESVKSDPGIHQLVPYFVNFISNEVTHHMDDLFVLRRMMELTDALVENPEIYLDPYASPISAPVLTCLLGRKLGNENGTDWLNEVYLLREFSASLIGRICQKYATSNKMLRPKITRTCLKHFLDINMPASVWYGAILGLSAAGGPEAIRVLAVQNFKSFSDGMLQKLKDGGADSNQIELEAILGAIVKAIRTLLPEKNHLMANGVNGVSDRESGELKDFLGELIGEKVARLGDHQLSKAVLEARAFSAQ
ncbi:putative TATA box binding protein associated factor (TAF) histone-like fold domain-containing protein [Seiridium cardinale]|uniref:TATA box binding protein associated factor (TAF) histone-like fold domain-containing protein n=1 Tax=Seiridium cardinale TaxID=138064 RepID=A0ABR2XVE4_9PEZI